MAFEKWQYSMASNNNSIDGVYLSDRTASEWSAWLERATLAKIEAYKKHNSCTNNEALKGLLL